MHWDDLRYFLALARAKTLTAAARGLGVKHTTVSRRIQAMEKIFGKPLFQRNGGDFGLTEAGESMLSASIEMERAYHHVELHAADRSPVSTGLVRIGCTEGYGSTVLPRHLAKFHAIRPGIQIDLLVLPRAIQLPRNEADLVITIDRPARGAHTIVKLSDYRLSLYGSRDYLDQAPRIRDTADLRSHCLISYVDYLSVAKDLPFLDTSHGKLGRGMNSTSLLAQREAVIEGAGLAILPDYLVRGRADLCKVLPDEIDFVRTYWLITPIELQDSVKVRAVSDFLRKAAADEKL